MNLTPAVQNLLNINPIESANGEVVSFMYEFYNHDPYPVIIVTGFMPGNKITGINLHYLSFPIFRALLNSWGGNRSFNYFIIKNENVIRQAFRSYKINGILGAKKINWKAILSFLSIIRNYSPQEIAGIRDMIDQQILSRQPDLLDSIFGKFHEASINTNV